MQTISKKNFFWIIFASVLLFIAFCCRWVNCYPLFIKEESAVYVLWPVLKIITRNVIHISLLIAWCFSIRSRILEKRIRKKAEKNLADMCRDSWNWQKGNPMGYEE